VRIANFTHLAIPEQEVVSLIPDEARDLLPKIRKYADLPYLYVISEEQTASIADLMSRLKGIRSTCYPHAVFVTGGKAAFSDHPEVDVFSNAPEDPESLSAEITRYAKSKLTFDKSKLRYDNPAPLPKSVDVLIVGGGITGVYAAKRFQEKNLSFCIAEKGDAVGGIWTLYANTTSQVNTSEAAYRLIEPETRAHRDHSTTAEVLEDIHHIAEQVSKSIFTQAVVETIEKRNGGYRTTVTRSGKKSQITSKGVLLAINDRVGTPRTVSWKNQDAFEGVFVRGISDEALNVDWQDKRVVIIGMGAFAAENTRTALEGGARHVTVVCRRHGTICPKIIDYLNFSTAYDDNFEHDRKSNIRNMMLWKKLYDISGATQPECWMGKIKHEGHTISVSDLWFIAHHLKRLETVRGSVSSIFERGVIVGDRRIEADIVVSCVGFHRNASLARELCGYSEIYNNNYVDKDFMYLADAYIDDDAFNSFFGSSVLEMTKFYLDVYLEFFDSPSFEEMLKKEGIERIPIDDRRWSHYINGAMALTRAYPRFYEGAREQIDKRTANFTEAHDLETYIAANKREWIDAHRMLGGKDFAEEDCLPFVFEKLIEKKLT
jgi:NADPH-dependent glutamate synthase beta subunit-like oxidoreductase